jgi:hypothetical protein
MHLRWPEAQFGVYQGPDFLGRRGRVAVASIAPANLKERRADRRFSDNQSGKRRAVVIVRERNGNSLPAVFRSEGQALSFIKARIAKGTVVNADESPNWNELHSRFEMKRINHEETYSLDGAWTNWAEKFFRRMRRAEIGHHHHVAGPYLLRFAQEASWWEDNRRLSNGEQVNRIAGLAMASKPSVDFAGLGAANVQPSGGFRDFTQLGRGTAQVPAQHCMANHPAGMPGRGTGMAKYRPIAPYVCPQPSVIAILWTFLPDSDPLRVIRSLLSCSLANSYGRAERCLPGTSRNWPKKRMCR